MLSEIEGAGPDFFPRLLALITDAFSREDMCILECKDQESGEIVRVLATIKINKTNRKIEFYPLATLFESNPMVGIKMVNGAAVLASQKPMDKWVEEAKAKVCDVSKMN